MKRKLLIFGGIIAILMGVFVGSGQVYADANKCNKSFLGFNAWWNGLGEYMDDKCQIQSTDSKRIGSEDNAPAFVWTIALNILHDIFAAIGYISIALITFGGYMYITSSGDPGKATKARKTLTSAVIGLIIVLLANVIVDTIINTINLPTTGSCTVAGGLLNNVTLPNCNPSAASGDYANAIFLNIFDKALTAGAIMAVGFIVYGGISYITSNGSPEKTRKALRTLIFAAIGLVVVIAAAAITNFVMSSADTAVQNAMILTTWKG